MFQSEFRLMNVALTSQLATVPLPQVSARPQPRLDEAPAEPDRLGGAARVTQLGDDALWRAAEALLDFHRVDRHLRRLLLVGNEVCQRPQVAEIVVAEWQVEERLPRAGDPEPQQGGAAARELLAERLRKRNHARL